MNIKQQKKQNKIKRINVLQIIITNIKLQQQKHQHYFIVHYRDKSRTTNLTLQNKTKR